MQSFPLKRMFVRVVITLALFFYGCSLVYANDDIVPVFITLGQSNADGSAFADSSQDALLSSWYESSSNHGNLKIWYRSCQVQNQASNALGESARWCVDGSTVDFSPRWMNLWYKNDNVNGRSAMQMIHSFGTYSAEAAERRGIEGTFSKRFAEAFPDKELYVIKLGVSGSFISSWANPADDTNWNYFLQNMYKPAIDDLLAKGKTPVLAGIWWMQGCADKERSQSYYEEWLRKLVEKCRGELGFPKAKIYVGHILAPGENPAYPDGSAQYGSGVRAAQDAVAADTEGVEIIDTKDCDLQYESNFNGYLHFSHKGVNKLGEIIADKVIADGLSDLWAEYTGYLETFD